MQKQELMNEWVIQWLLPSFYTVCVGVATIIYPQADSFAATFCPYFPRITSRFHQRIKPCQDIRPESQNSPLLISISGTKPVVWRQQQGPVWWAHRGHSVSHYPDDFLMAVWLDSARNDMPLSRSVWFCLLVSWLFSRHVQALWRYWETELAAKKWVIRLWGLYNQACHAMLPTDDDSGIRV